MRSHLLPHCADLGRADTRCRTGWDKIMRRQSKEPGSSPGRFRLLARFFRPRLEILENRVYPGDVVLGLWTVAWWGRGAGSLEPLSALDAVQHAPTFARASGLSNSNYVV